MEFDTEYVHFTQEGSELAVERKNDTKVARSRHGLYRSLAQNLVLGVTEGFSKTMEIKGVGYRGALQGSILELNLGFSHPVKYQLPPEIEVVFQEKSQNIFTISGMNKQQVGQIAAEIRSFRKPEPYKGKGIRYIDEQVARKAGKAASK
jgi:large subunit ribosomal protein L6